MDRFLGRYPGTVVDNDDPLALSRVRAQVPEILGEETTGWCLPSMPYAGSGAGFAAVPPVGALVHVEWPAGDVTRVPVWSGAAWEKGAGVPGAGPDTVVLLTPGGNRIELTDESGGEAVELTAASGALVALDTNGVRVEFGAMKIAITRSSVSVNDGALEVS